MQTFLGGLALFANLASVSGQGPTNRPPDPAPITVECCAPVAAPVPPQPAGTNKGLLNEPLILSSLVDTIVSREKNEDVVKSGPYVKFGTGITGAGWLSLGPGYKQLIGKRLLLDVSTAVSWRRYTSARGRLELRPFANSDLTVGAQVLGQDWTQVQYYGLGMASLREDRSQYRMRATDVTAYMTLSPGRVLDLRLRGGALSRPRISGATGWNIRDLPDTQNRFTDFTAPGVFVQPRFWHGDIGVSANTLDHPDHPTRGLLLQAAASQYEDRDLDRFSFRRYDATAVAFVPLIGNLWTIGARGIAVATETSGANEVPFYMLPTLGQGVLRGFDTDRFRDRNLMALNLESRWAVFPHLDLALFGDIGGVARRFDELNWDHFESSYGVGLRLHTGARTFFRIDAARSGQDKGWKFQIRLTESLKFSNDQRWQTIVPLVR
jgi:hypothetical protein